MESGKGKKVPDLPGCDISTPEGYEKAVREDLMLKVWEDLVADAAKMIEEMI